MEELTNSLTSPSISSSSFSEHNIIALENGDVYSFGDNDHGQCSNGTNNNVLTPTKIMNNKNIKSIVLGVYHSFYLEKNGDLYGCGYNKNSELGISNNTTDRNKFVFVTSNVVKVSASYLFTVIQKDNGKLFFTGRGMNKFSKGFTEIVGIEDIISFSCGENNVIFLKRGEVWVMGNNEFGQCGFNKSVKNIQKPTLLMKDQNIFDICCGYQHSFILTRDEKGNTLLKCFGNNSFGSLGLNDRKEKIFGVQTISQFPNIRSVHCGANHSFILTEQGDVYSCGNNAYGQLSLGDNSNRLIFSKTSLSNIILIATGWNHSIFLDDERKVFVCGRGYYGSVGLGDTKDRKVATKLDLKDKPKLFHNSGLVCLSSDYIEVKFSFIMEIEGEEEITKKQVFRNIKKSQLIGTMIQQVLLENNYFGIEKFDLKIMVPQIIQINNKNFDLNKINDYYSEWKEKENKIKLIYSLSNTKFDKENSTFTNFISRKDLSETQKDLFISQLEYYVYDLKNQISNLKNEILKKDVTLSQKDLLVSQSEKEKTEKQEKLHDLRKIICKEKQKINSISSFQIEHTQKDYCFVEPLREIFVCGVCKELMENAQICSECKKNCCKKCCENEKFCPFGCEKEEMDDYPGLQKKISNLIVKCFCCEKQFKLNEIEEHSRIVKVSCRWKHVGCEFSETKNLVLLHEIECEFFLEEQKKQKLKYFENIPLFFQQITQILDK